jgi:hypothetical protein
MQRLCRGVPSAPALCGSTPHPFGFFCPDLTIGTSHQKPGPHPREQLAKAAFCRNTHWIMQQPNDRDVWKPSTARLGVGAIMRAGAKSRSASKYRCQGPLCVQRDSAAVPNATLRAHPQSLSRRTDADALSSRWGGATDARNGFSRCFVRFWQAMVDDEISAARVIMEEDTDYSLADLPPRFPETLMW